MIRHIYIVIIILFLIGIYIFNFLTPMYNDDYAANFNYANQFEKISGIKQIVKSQLWFYLNWGGNVVQATFQQIFAVWVKKPVFDVLNTLVLLITSILITFSVNRRESRNVLLVMAFVWIFAPVPGETIFWMIASIAYLWPTFLALIFFLFKNKIKNKFILTLCATVLGALSLNVSMILIPFYGLKWAYGYFVNRKLDIRQLLILCGLIFGFLFLFFAPGNMKRYHNMYVAVSLMERLPDFLTYLLKYLKNNSVLCMIVIIYLMIMSKKLQLKRVISQDYSLLFACAFISPVSMFFAPEYSERTTFAAFIFMLPFTVEAFTFLLDLLNSKFIKDVIYLFFVFVSSLVFALSIETKLMIYTNDFNNKKLIMEAKANGKAEVELDVLDIPSERNTFIYNIRKDKNYIANQYMAAFFDLKSVREKGNYMKLTFDNIVVGNFCLHTILDNGDPFYNCQMVYNKFDGNSVFFDLPDPLKLDSHYIIEFFPRDKAPFILCSIEMCRGIQIYKIDEEYVNNNIFFEDIVDKKNPANLTNILGRRIQFKWDINT